MESEVERAGRLLAILRRSPVVAPILDDWAGIALPDCRLVAGALAQTVWNEAFELPPRYGIDDVDLVYFDPADLSQETEARHAARIAALFAGLTARFGLRVDVKNQARVHLWYEGKFGMPLRPYRSTADAIATYPTTATTLGIRPTGEGMDICAPFGLEDLMGLVVRANKTLIPRPVYEAKAARWRALWPGLTFLPWDHAA